MLNNYENETEITFIDDDIDIPKRTYTRYGVYAKAIDDFMASDHKCLCFACKNKNHTASVRHAVSTAIKKKYHNCVCYVRSMHVYMLKG